MTYETILYEEDGPIGWLTLNRPDDGNMFTPQMCHEIRDCINEVRRETRTRVLVITGFVAPEVGDRLRRHSFVEAVLVKPFDVLAFARHVRQLRDRPRPAPAGGATLF